MTISIKTLFPDKITLQAPGLGLHRSEAHVSTHINSLFQDASKGGAEFFCFVEEEHGRMESEPLGFRRDWGRAVYLYKAGSS